MNDAFAVPFEGLSRSLGVLQGLQEPLLFIAIRTVILLYYYMIILLYYYTIILLY